MDWKDLFQKHILNRGYNYYCENLVENLDISEDILQATVLGSENYEVEIYLEQDQMLDMYCSCPYAEDGKNCKHMAAVLFKWEEMRDSEAQHQKVAEQNDREREIKEFVSSVDETLVRNYLEAILLNDEKQWLNFKSLIQPEISGEEVEYYKQQIDEIQQKYEGYHGFIDYYKAMNFIDEIYDILDNDIRRMIKNDKDTEAFQLIDYIFEMIGTVEMDDSDGGIGIIVNQCCDLWMDILGKSSIEEKHRIFQLFLSKLDSSVTDDVKEYIEQIIMEDFQETEFLEEKLQFTDRMAKKYKEWKFLWPNDYYVGTWAVRHLNLMKNSEFKWDEIELYCKQYWQSPMVRKNYIDLCVQRKKYDLALEILKESIQMDEDYRGLVIDYNTKIKDIYKMIGDAEKYQEQLWALILKYDKGNLEIFRELKSYYSAAEWKDVREKIFSNLSPYSHIDILYKEEKMYDRLLKIVQESPGLWLLEQYESVLKECYPDEILQKYRDELNEMAKRASNRKRYKEFAILLRKMKKIKGGTKVVENIVKSWRNIYKRRPAMMDELRGL